jgi:hypothetical protein
MMSALTGVPNAFAQTQEEQVSKALDEEKHELKIFDVLKLHRLLLPYKLSPRVGIFSGYDSNVNLDHSRKGDVFEEFAFSLGFSKPWLENIKWSEGIKFTFDYDLDVLNYNEFTDASNILNHVVFGLHKRYAPFLVGTGYDLGIIYYPHNDDGDFLFHKGFLYLRQNILKNLYHQLRLESGYKQYTNEEALADSLDARLEKKRHDYRYSADYSVGAYLNPKLFLKINGKYSINNANAVYLDFYDYTAYEGGLSADYRLLDKLSLFSKLSFIRKDYSRTVTLRDYEEHDNYYAATLGATYHLNKNNSLIAYYTRRQNSSNDHLQEYFENVFTGGWQYSF